MEDVEELPHHLFTPVKQPQADLHFRLATESDLRPLYQTFYAHRPYNEFRSRFQRALKRQGDRVCFWLVAQSGGLLVGNGQLVLYPHAAELANLSVIGERQGEGIGTSLLLILIAIARHIDVTNLEIGVTTDNVRALALYHRLGFEEDRRLHLSGSQSAIILRKAL